MFLPRQLSPVQQSEIPAWADRSLAALLVATALFFVVILRYVEPDVRGHGTHEKFGLQACGWVKHYGKPCPTCGVTTAGSHLVHLRPLRAIAVQPFGAALGLFGLWLAGVAAYCLLRGRAFADYLLLLPGRRLMVYGLILLLGSWGYIAHDFQAN